MAPEGEGREQPVTQQCWADTSELCMCSRVRDGWTCWTSHKVGWCLGIARYSQASCGSNVGLDIAAGKGAPRAGPFKLDVNLDLSRGTTELVHLCSLRDENGSTTVRPRPRERGGCVCMGQLCRGGQLFCAWWHLVILEPPGKKYTLVLYYQNPNNLVFVLYECSQCTAVQREITQKMWCFQALPPCL